MKKAFVLLAIGIKCFFLNGQEYHPMLTDSCTWYMVRTFEGTSTDEFYISGDTLMNAKKYFKLFKGSPFYKSNVYAYLREDLEKKRIYLKGFNSFANYGDTSEILYCDFNLSVNDKFLFLIPTIDFHSFRDSIGLHYGIATFIDTVGWLSVTSISKINTLAGIRTLIRLCLSPCYYWGQVAFIESIGLVYYYEYSFEHGLSCFFRKGIKEFTGDDLDAFGLAIGYSGSCDVSVGEAKSFKTEDLKVYLGNNNEQLIISLKNNSLGYFNSFKLVNLNGCTIKQSRILANEATIDVSELPAGMYIVLIFSKDKVISKKIIK
jgi:hypothetical protein